MRRILTQEFGGDVKLIIDTGNMGRQTGVEKIYKFWEVHFSQYDQ